MNRQAMLDRLAERGITGHDAEIGLDTAIRKLTSPEPAALTCMRALGIAVWDDDDQVRDDVFDQFLTYFARLDESSEDMAYRVVFGADAMRIAIAAGRT